MKLLTNLLFEPKGKHDPALAYNIKDTVMSADGSKVYFALQDVPAGIALDNEDYWKLQIDLSSSKSAMDQALASFGSCAKSIGTRVRGETAGASGNPVTFLPDAGSLLQPVTVLDVQQAGSGEPSPDNIRPITGWDKLGLNHAGKNLCPYVQHNEVVALRLFAGRTYVVSIADSSASDITLLLYNDGTGASYFRSVPINRVEGGRRYGTFTLDRDTTHINFTWGATSALIEPQIEESLVVTPYEPHQRKLHTVQIGQTVYGGRFDWLTGKFIVTDELRTYNGSEGWFSNSGAVDSLFAISLDAAVNSVSACSHTPVVNETVPQSTIGCGYYSEYGVLYLNLTGGQKISVEDFKAKLAASPVQVAYKLANPIEIQLTPHIISAADPEQTNTLYGDGRIDAEYVKPLHVSIEERVAAALAAAKE